MSEIYSPDPSFQKKAHFQSLEEYHQEYERSTADPEAWWAEQEDSFHWYKKWETICTYNYDMDDGPISIRWFDGGKTNIVYNCLDRHLQSLSLIHI